jgi:membrane protein DedA with SNARE-associated domain
LFSSALCDTILYRIGRKAIHSKKVIAFIDRSNFLSDNFKTMERLWANHPIKTMLLGKNAFMIGVAVVISAGMAKMNYLRFLLYDIPACFLQLIVLLSIGYYLGN